MSEIRVFFSQQWPFWGQKGGYWVSYLSDFGPINDDIGAKNGNFKNTNVKIPI